MRKARTIEQGREPTLDDLQITCEWVDPQSPTLAQTSDALFKQQAMGAIPPRADAVRKRLGWSPIERQQFEIADRTDMGEEVLRELAGSSLAKAIRTDASVVKTIAGGSTPGAANDGASNVNGGQ